MPAGGAFLHSPLLDELKAIQDVLAGQVAAQEDVQLVEVADTSAKAKARAQAQECAQAQAKGAAEAAAPPLQERSDSAGDGAAGRPPLQPLQLRRDSWGASSSSAGGAPATTELGREGSAALAAILESPTCMLSSSDFEWSPDEGASSSLRSAQLRQPPSLDLSPLRTAGAHPASAAGAGSSLFHPDDAADAPASPGGSLFRDKELECCICLDVLYKPVGLACGHKVRLEGIRCLFGAQAWGGRWHGPFWSATRRWSAAPSIQHSPHPTARPPAVLQAVRPGARGAGARGGHVCKPLLLREAQLRVPAVPAEGGL